MGQPNDLSLNFNESWFIPLGHVPIKPHSTDAKKDKRNEGAMQRASDKPQEQHDLTKCWLCGEPIAVDRLESLNIDGAYVDLHPGCKEQVDKSVS